ncbi:vascular endothelial growth factor receptor 2 isoform X1 [Protopterus annectens]|uniref:vascular endothelial growth factor receptor 2 isoform X1 n=1 Tax=Protopterus annectens TaxID=7888 RepID=UPI001CFB8AE0|nr:vascular endothelial growth factor receptor 2 isoform X1 [Protopterus annectens]
MNHILPPTLSIQKDVYRISVNETLTIRCWGNQSLEWTWLKDKTVTDSHITVNDCIHQSPFCKMLTLSKAMANDTGSYQCSYQDSESMNNATSASIYIYVEDPRSPFVTSPVSNHPEVVYIGDNNTTLIRCVGSMADLNVTLIARYPEKEFIADGKTMHWDSKTGFTIPGNLIKYAGYVFCKTRIDGESHVSSLYIVAVVGYMMYSLNLNPYPQVELTERATLTVECLAETELNVGVKFVWHYNAQELLPDGRVTFKAHRHAFSQRLKLSSTLILVNITTKDSGNYSCTVDSGRMTLSKSTRVLIYEKTFIAMEPGMGLEYEVNAGQNIEIPVKFKSYPKPEVKWYKNGEILNHNYRITAGYTLSISDLNEEDSGVYEVILTNPVTKEKHPHQYNLVVNVPPRILENALSLPRDYFEYGSEQKLTCTIDAVPAPETIQWQWLSEEDCPIGDKKRDFGKVSKQHNCKGWKNISDSSGGNQIKKYEALQNRVNKYKIRTTSTLEIQAANTSAFYRCLARNKAGEDKRMIFFQVTWGLDIHVFPVNNPIESENVVLQCTTKKKRYVNLTWYKLSSNTSHCQHGMKQCRECKNPDDFHKLSSIDCDTDYANVSLQLRFQNISLQDQGMYVCMARNQKTNEIQCLTKYVLVQERMPPAVIGLQHASVNASETLEITCNVSGVPTPRITWFKNNQTVLKDSGVVFLESNQTLTIQRVKKEDSGVYTCLACNDLGCSWTEATISVQDSEVKTNNELILLICAAVFSLFLWLLLVILFRIVKRSTRKDVKTGYLSIIMDPDELPLGDHSDQLSYDAQKWEFPRDRLRLGKPLGRGAFGQVVEATAFGIDKSSTCKTVAVKMLKEGATSSEHRALLSELKILIHIGHHLNVVNLLGACTKPGGPLMVIVEYCKNGNLSNYLRGKRDEFVSYKTKPLKPRHIKDKYTDYILWQMKCRLDSIASSHSSASSGFLEERSISEADEEAGEDPCKNLLTMEDLISYSFQVARGMDFLASRKCIHRDLAARNILLSESNIVKICDFGLARDIYKDPDYVRKGDARLPLKWMAPETIFDRVYTTQSDVWSFGVLLWEIFSLGASPYPGVPIDENFCRRLKEGTRMKMPDYASPEIYQTMLCCWHDEPKLRPTFSELVDHLGNLLQAYAQQDGKDYIPLTMTQNMEDDSGVSLQTSPVSCMEEGESCEPMFHYVNGIPNRNYLQSAKGPSRPVSIKTFDSVPVELPETILQEDNMTDSGMILSNDELQMLENRITQQSIPLSNIDSSKSKDSLTSETSTQTSDYQSGYHSDDMGAATNTADEKELLLGVQVSQSYHVPSVNYDTAVQYSTHID